MSSSTYKVKSEKRLLKEADTRVKLVDPKLHAVGWDENSIEREYTISEGRIDIIGDEVQRRQPKWIDYVLRLSAGATPIAVIEAKAETKSAMSGMQEAKAYAEKMGVYFAYATNGYEIQEFNYLNNRYTKLDKFPSPQELQQKYFKAQHRLLKSTDAEIQTIAATPFYSDTSGFQLRYYQEAAIDRALEEILKGKKRLLLNLATGTGKTVISFNLSWRLIKAKKIKRVLFLADRIFLRDQAHNQAFAPFADARGFIPDSNGNINKTRDVYFSIYQSLYAQASDGKRIYQHYPQDFFDLIIIDECHRSGFGTWHEILKYFSNAIHLGMTATPKREDNIDSYQYFGQTVYSYSFGTGVDDGYLSPFLVHRVLTNIDKQGKLSLEDARTQGAEIIYSEEIEPKDLYELQEFERTITLPDRTRTITRHLAKTLRLFDPMGKTMVFCVNMDHAEEVAAQLQNEFSELGISNYAVPIISRSGDIKVDVYERFKDSDKSTPVIATTVDLLTTGVDVPSVKNIVIIKPIASKVVFKQIIGRGCRIDPLVNKHFFRIFDYVGATRLFDDWEKPPQPLPPVGPVIQDKYLTGVVVDSDTQQPIQSVRVTLQIKANVQEYQQTDAQGRFSFKNLPDKKLGLLLTALGYKKRQLAITPFTSADKFIVIEMKKLHIIPRKKVKVIGLPVHIAEENTIVLEKDGKSLKVTEYVSYTKNTVKKQVRKPEDLIRIWVNREQRQEFLQDLAEKSIYPKLLAQILNHQDTDPLDLLSSVVFGSIPLSRNQRVEAFENLQQQFINSFSQDAKEIIFALLDKYRSVGIDEVINPKVFELPPFDKLGYITGVIQKFGSGEQLSQAITQIEQRLYLNYDRS